jgi:hypothetical protein
LGQFRTHTYFRSRYGKVDIGADLIEAKDEKNATVVGYHGGPIMSITGRSADIRKPTKPDPIQVRSQIVIPDHFKAPCSDFRLFFIIYLLLSDHERSKQQRASRGLEACGQVPGVAQRPQAFCGAAGPRQR